MMYICELFTSLKSWIHDFNVIYSFFYPQFFYDYFRSSVNWLLWVILSHTNNHIQKLCMVSATHVWLLKETCYAPPKKKSDLPLSFFSTHAQVLVTTFACESLVFYIRIWWNWLTSLRYSQEISGPELTSYWHQKFIVHTYIFNCIIFSPVTCILYCIVTIALYIFSDWPISKYCCQCTCHHFNVSTINYYH